MAYSRTTYKRAVRCSYCRQTGHNRSGCPDFKALMERRRENDPNDWRVQEYDAKKARRSRKGKDRACSYCGNKGHNRATCSDLKKHIFKCKDKNAAFRAAVLERFKALGVGVGAILSSDRNKQRIDPEDWDSPTYRVPQVVTGICWDNINYWNRSHAYFDNDSPLLTRSINNIQAATPVQMGWPWDIELIGLVLGELEADRWNEGSNWKYGEKASIFCEVESPVSTNTPPDKWLDGGDLKFYKRVFKKRCSYDGVP